MKYLHQIGERKFGPNFNTLEEILAYNGPLSFDGVYMSVYENYKALKGKEIIFFPSWGYLGGTNAFDITQPLSRFCTFEQILEMADYLVAKIGHHGNLHLNCRGLSLQHIAQEIKLPTFGHNQRFFVPVLAWPYGDFDANSIAIAKRLGYEKAYSAMQGDDSNPYTLKRTLLNW